MFDTNEQYGICHLSVAPVRTEPSDKAEIGTQILFGDVFTILKFSEDRKWVFILIAFDSYQGWIDPKQYQQISKVYFDEYLSTQHPLSNDLITYISTDKNTLPILYGSILPFVRNGRIDMENVHYSFKGEYELPEKIPTYKSIEKLAKNYLGAPYLWGGKCHFGIDCSGLVQQVYKMTGIQLPRDAWQQGQCGTLTEFLNALPGDLIFFNNPQGRIIHVGILLELGRIIHASGEVRIDQVDGTGIFNVERKIYTHKLHSVRRFFA